MSRFPSFVAPTPRAVARASAVGGAIITPASELIIGSGAAAS